MITAEQKLLRMGKLGSSDAAAVMGLDPYRSASDVFLVKTGQAADFEGNANTERGNLLEPVVMEWACQQINWKYFRSPMFEHPSGMLVANLDGLNEAGTEIIEAKTTVDPEGWGEEGTDQVPERVLAQVHHQFVCVPAAVVAWVPVLMPGFKRFDFRLYKVNRNEDLCAAVESAGLAFMNEHVLRGVPPDDFRPSLEVLKRVRRQPNKFIPVADELVDGYVVARAAKASAEEELEKRQSYLLAALGDAEGGTYSAGSVTYLETTRRGYEVKETTYRQLRIKTNKKETANDSNS